MRPDHYRLILLKTAQRNEFPDARLNTWTMGDKGRERVVKVRPAVRSQGLVGNATMDLFAIDDSKKPDNPAGGIIRFTGGKFSVHDTTFFAKATPG
jgi:hypothetical protein